MNHGLLRQTLAIATLLASATGPLALAAPVPEWPTGNACSFPADPGQDPEKIAWRIFVAANCPAANNKLTWETWPEQLRVYPPTSGSGGKQVRRLHGSPLTHANLSKGGTAVGLAPSKECGTMSNIIPGYKNGVICEEVRLNPAAAAYVRNQNLQTRPGQMKASKIDFPAAAIEIKVDWVPASDFATPFTCDKPPADFYVEQIDGTCYALLGMHISSKLWPNWIWATFEPQSMTSNPLRCTLYGACKDNWGSVPATSNGGAAGFTKQTAQLQQLMKDAKLAKVFLNYRMDGTQVDFGTTANPTILGNSIIEWANAGVPKNQASCITCHSVSSIQSATGLDGFTIMVGGKVPLFGPATPLPAGWLARDFVWSLGIACPANPATGLRPDSCQ